MSNTKALVLKPVTPDVWNMIGSISHSIHKSRIFGVTSEEAAQAIMLKGYELGIALTASFEFIQIVQGKPTLIPRGALALVQRSGELEGMKIEDKPTSCTVWMKRRNGMEYTTTYSVEDARRAGLVKAGSAWESYPGNLCRWRAIGFCIDVLFADVTGGMKRADEMGAAVNEAGDVVEGQWQTAPSTATQPEPAQPNMTLEILIDRYGPDAIMVANGGAIPATTEDVQRIAALLGG